MLRRSILEISCRRRIPKLVATQIPSFLSSRKEFSTASSQNASKGPGSTGKPPEPKSGISKLVLGSIVIGAATMTAYQTGYLDQILSKEQHDTLKSTNFYNTDTRDAKISVEPATTLHKEEPIGLNMEQTEKNIETHSDAARQEDKSDTIAEEIPNPNQESDLPGTTSSLTSDEQNANLEPSKEESTDMNTGNEQNEVSITAKSSRTGEVLEDKKAELLPPQHRAAEDMPEDAPAKVLETPSPLLDDYNLRDKSEESTTTSNGQDSDIYKDSFKVKEASVGAFEELDNAYVTKDGKLVLDFLQAIHAAENRQAELDARVFAEEKRMMKEKYEKELKDARVRELMYAEEAAILDKELAKERVKAAAAIKSLQEKAEEKLKTELEQKEREAELELKKVEALAKAELAAAISREKAAQVEKMAEANLNINALCMAFYARSEEARQTHSVHKIALGALALEDALTKGLPIQKEMEALHSYIEGVDGDSLIKLVLSSLPDETQNCGTDTLLQLNQKFDALKGTLRHFSLIPPGGGGILAHSLAHVASWLKVKEASHSGDGIESVINRVENYLAEGKLAEAADTLEEGVRDSKAAEVVGDWVRQARNRAITEQALTLLQSYATSVSLT